MVFTRTTITQQMAAAYLLVNTTNRPLNREKISQYAKDMEAGRWKADTGECIKISKTGKMIDGQSRMLAIIKSNATVDLTIATGIDDNLFDIIDTGAIRDGGDSFTAAGIKNPQACASIITAYAELKARNKESTGSGFKLTNTILLNEYEVKPEFWQDVTGKAKKWHKEIYKIVPTATIGSLYAMFFEVDEEEANTFFKQLSTGSFTNITIGKLRNLMFLDKMATQKLRPICREAIIIKAWNCFRTGKDNKTLKYDPTKENFPIAI